MRISSIECGRVVAIMAVMAIHLSPFSNPFDPTLWDGTLGEDAQVHDVGGGVEGD